MRSDSLQMCRRVFLGAMLLAPALPGTGLAQPPAGYPDRPIRIVVPFPTGGGADLTARMLAQAMAASLGQPVIVDNRPGANGVVGADLVAKSAPDGYTLLLVDRGALGINPSLYRSLPYDPLKSFAYVGIATHAPYVLVANTSLPVQDVADLIALSKSKPRSIHYGSFGIGSMAQLNFEAFNKRHGTDLEHVPYKGAGPAVRAVVSGEVAVAIASAPSVLAFIREGRLRALAVGADRRLDLLPQVPTLQEAGGAAGTLLATYFAVAAPAGTAPEVVKRLHAELRLALERPEVAQALRSNGLVPDGGPPEALARTVADDVERFRSLVRDIGLRPE